LSEALPTGPVRGRPRSAAADAAILDAALEEYAERGFDGLSVDAVAARAGVGKATIYRRYGSKVELVRDAMYLSAEQKAAPDTGSVRGDLQVLLHHLDLLVHDPTLGAGLRHMVADGVANPELGAVHDVFVQHRRAGTKRVLQQAIDRGELRPDTDLELATDLLTGPVFLRHLMTHMPVDAAFLTGVLEDFLRAYSAE
jgi:AcrR family transcriptional regulator